MVHCTLLHSIAGHTSTNIDTNPKTHKTSLTYLSHQNMYQWDVLTGRNLRKHKDCECYVLTSASVVKKNHWFFYLYENIEYPLFSARLCKTKDIFKVACQSCPLLTNSTLCLRDVFLSHMFPMSGLEITLCRERLTDSEVEKMAKWYRGHHTIPRMSFINVDDVQKLTTKSIRTTGLEFFSKTSVSLPYPGF